METQRLDNWKTELIDYHPELFDLPEKSPLPNFFQGCWKVLKDIYVVFLSGPLFRGIFQRYSFNLDEYYFLRDTYELFNLSDFRIREDLIKGFPNVSQKTLEILLLKQIILKIQMLQKNSSGRFEELPFRSLDSDRIDGIMPGDILFVRADISKASNYWKDLFFGLTLREGIVKQNGFHFSFSHVYFYLGDGEFADYSASGIKIHHAGELMNKPIARLPYYLIIGPRHKAKNRRKNQVSVDYERRDLSKSLAEDMEIIRLKRIITYSKDNLNLVISRIRNEDYPFRRFGYEKVFNFFFHLYWGRNLLVDRLTQSEYEKVKDEINFIPRLLFIFQQKFLYRNPNHPICSSAVGTFARDSGIYHIRKHSVIEDTPANLLFSMFEFDSIEVRSVNLPDFYNQKML